MRGHGTALAHLLFLAARRRPHEFGLHGCLLRSHPLTLPTAPISFNFLAVNDIARRAAPGREHAGRHSGPPPFHPATPPCPRLARIARAAPALHSMPRPLPRLLLPRPSPPRRRIP